MPPGKQSKSKEDTWKEDELKKSLKDISDDRRKKEERRKSGREEEDRKRRKEERRGDEKENKRDDRRKSGKDDDRRKSSTRDDDRRRHKDDSERRRHRDEDGERRRHRDENGERRRPKDEDNERRRHRDEEGERRRHRDEDGERRRHRDEDGERRRHRDEDGERRRHRDEDGERRRHRDEDGERRRHRDEDGERRRHRDEDGERRRHRDEDGERRRHRDDESDRRRKDDDSDRRRRKEDDSSRRRKEDDSERRRRRDETEEERRERKRRERKEREEAESSQNDVQPTKSSSSTTRAVSSSILNGGGEEEEEEEEEEDVMNREEVNGAEEEYNYDDEDFEEYEDDFDDESQASGSEKEAESPAVVPYREHGDSADVWRAVNQENQKLLSPRRRHDSDSDSGPTTPQPGRSRPPPGGRFINFVSAKQRSVSDRAATRVRRRFQDLCKMIELDFVSYDLFDMPPVNEYDRYILNYGRSDTKQAYIQTNDDAVDQELQTDDTEHRDKWTQQPADDNTGCGGDTDDDNKRIDHRPINYARLERFVREAGRVMTILLEEDASRHAPSEERTNQSTAYSDIVVRLAPPTFLKDSPVIAASFSPSQSYQLLTAHTTRIQNPSHPLYGCGLVYEWNLNQPSVPQRLLAVRAVPNACCFSPNSTDIAFAGTADGSVVLWDLREPGSNHRSVQLSGKSQSGDDTVTVRAPTYSTAMVLGSEGHNSSVVSVCPLMSATEWGRETLTGTKTDRGLSFQLATLEQNGVIFIWVVAQLDKADPGGSESDLGLAPGGRVRLIKSAQILVEGPQKVPVSCTGMQLLTNDANQFYVTTDAGQIIRCSRHGSVSGPRHYENDLSAPVRITSLDVSPFDQPCFLVGTSEGEIRLHRADQSAPATSWDHVTRQPIKSVRWSRSRACVFYVMDVEGGFYGFDLSSSDNEPFMRERVDIGSISCLELGSDFSATGLGSQGRRPQMVVCSASGVMEVHTWAKNLIRAELDETYKLGKYIHSLT